jgi:hypothetical protein
LYFVFVPLDVSAGIVSAIARDRFAFRPGNDHQNMWNVCEKLILIANSASVSCAFDLQIEF